MRLIFTCFYCIVMLTMGCQSPKPKQIDLQEVSFTKAVEIDQRLLGIDSTVIVYYDDPYGSDSLRYTRFYTQASLKGDFVQRILPAQFQTVYTKMEKRNACRGEGKIWCYSQGKITQTLYFSTHCKDNCCYVYFIKDGFFYYTHPLQSFVDALNNAKVNAKKPDQPVRED